MKSSRRTINSSIKGNSKIDKEEKERKKKEQIEAKNQEKEVQFKKLEEYVNESGLSLAFNIIFAELISKQIMPENFFTYTSMRLKQIGKEIEGLKTKEEINVDKNEEEDKKEINNEEPSDNKLFQANKKDEDNVLLTVPPKKKK
jgi:hypothetical protein